MYIFKMLQLMYVGFLARALEKARTLGKTHDLGKRREGGRRTSEALVGRSMELH